MKFGSNTTWDTWQRGARAAVLAAGVALTAACAGGGGDGDDAELPVASPESFDVFGLFVNFVDGIILPQYEAFATSSAVLAAQDGPIADWCAAIDTDNEREALGEARAAWRTAMWDFEATEMHQLGPVVDDGGERRHRIITPTETNFSSCGVDQSVVLSRSPDFDLSSRLDNQKGLVALEYLLFNPDLAHTCPRQIPETLDWDARPAVERRQWRCDHALRLAGDVAEAAESIAADWRVEGGNYRATFASPDNDQASLEQLSEALFYLEKDTKDRKLGPVMGLQSSCSRVACPDRALFGYSRASLASISANLRSFRRLFAGAGGAGFDDLIASEGLREVANRMLGQIDDAIALADSIESPLIIQAQDLLDSDDESVCLNSAANPDSDQTIPACALHGLMKRITDSLRTDFITIVDIDLPERVQSDND